MKHRFVLALCILLLLTAPSQALAASRGYAAGWHTSRPYHGFSLRIPVQQAFYFQPVLAFSFKEQQQTSTKADAAGHFSLGLRGIWNLPSRSEFAPYTGLAWGYSNNYAGKTLREAGVVREDTGLETFIGVEYSKYFLRPALEICLGGYSHKSPEKYNFYAGISYSFSLLYYF